MKEKGEVTKNIALYMSSLGRKVYSVNEVSAIHKAVNLEYLDRKKNNIKINANTKFGKELIRIRTIKFVSDVFINKLTKEDICLYKKCRIEEYENRTGKCSWGIPRVRKYYGYDPETGFSISD